MFYFAEVAHTI